MRILALDHGARRTGAAVCDPTETVVRPLTVLTDVDAPGGVEAVAALAAAEEVQLVVVGVPVSLSGGEHGQAKVARAFAYSLAAKVHVPVETFDERFTTKLARARGGSAGLDARAAAVLLEDYLRARHSAGESERRP